MAVLKIVLLAFLVAVSLGEETNTEVKNENTEVKLDKTEVKPEKASGHYLYDGDGYFDDFYGDYDLYDDGYWYGYEPYWPGFDDFWGFGGYGRRHHGGRHHHRRGRGRSSSSSSSSESRSRSRSSESSSGDRDNDNHNDENNEHRCPRPRPQKIHKACKAVKIGTRYNGTVQVEAGDVAHGGSVEVKCSGGLVLRDDKGPVTDVRLKCHDGEYKPNINSDKLKQLHCEAVPKCFSPLKLFQPVRSAKYTVIQTTTLTNEVQEQPVGTKVSYKCRKIGSSGTENDLPEYLLWFFVQSKLVVVDPPSPGPYEPTLEFTCNSQGLWETSYVYGREFVNGAKATPFTTVGQLTYGGVICDDVVIASLRDS